MKTSTKIFIFAIVIMLVVAILVAPLIYNLKKISEIEASYQNNTYNENPTEVITTEPSNDSSESFWDYTEINELREELEPQGIYLNSSLNKNALSSLLKKYGEKSQAINDYIQFFGEVGGDSPGGISKDFNFDDNELVCIKKDENPLEMKYAAWHEEVYNVWELIANNENYLNTLNQYLEDAKNSNDDDDIIYYEGKIKEAEDTLDKMSKDPMIESIRNNRSTYEDMTIDEIAYIGANYTTGYWDRPEDANYTVRRVFIMNGDSSSTTAYSEKPRAKQIIIEIEGNEFVLDLEDTPECQIFDIDYATYEIAKPLEIKVKLLQSYDKDNVTTEAYLSSICFDIAQSIFVGGR